MNTTTNLFSEMHVTLFYLFCNIKIPIELTRFIIVVYYTEIMEIIILLIIMLNKLKSDRNN